MVAHTHRKQLGFWGLLKNYHILNSDNFIYGSSSNFPSFLKYKASYNYLRNLLSSIVTHSQAEKEILAHISSLVIYVLVVVCILSHLYAINKLC